MNYAKLGSSALGWEKCEHVNFVGVGSVPRQPLQARSSILVDNTWGALPCRIGGGGCCVASVELGSNTGVIQSVT